MKNRVIEYILKLSEGKAMYGVPMLVIILLFCVFAVYLAFRKKKD